MKDKEKQIEEMPICVNCVHAYVCEKYNLNRDMLRKRCAYHNDHFLDIEQHGIKLRKKTAEKCKQDISQLLKEHFGPGFYRLSCRDVIDDYFEKQYGLKEDTIKRILMENIEKDEK